jgi:hypothetical protein
MVLALVYPALALAGLDGGVVASLAGIVVGSALYLALAVMLWPSVGGEALRLARGRPT